MREGMIWLAGCALLASCGGNVTNDAAGETTTNLVTVATPTAPVETVPVEPAKPAQGGWTGKWVGVEGLVLDIAAAKAPGTYRLHIALMDGAGDYTGTVDGDVIRFTRDGVAEAIRHTSGVETGLKWLADKKDCLTIKPGEGFCRD